MYETYYNLIGKPFRLGPDPRFFFSSQGHKRALAYLRYGIRQGEGFIIITGEVGTGKTLLVKTLFQMLANENIVGNHIVTTQMQADDMLRMVAAGFGLEYRQQSKASLLRDLEGYFISCAERGKRVLLVVDEAQGLPRKSIEELRMLSNFTHKGRSLLQSFLMGQREFRATMRSEGFEQLRQRVIAAYHLQPLDASETRAYVEHRLRMVRWNNTNPRIADEVFGGIHEFTEGVPRRINNLCDRLLLYGYLEELDHISKESFSTVAHDILEEQGATGAHQSLATQGEEIDSERIAREKVGLGELHGDANSRGRTPARAPSLPSSSSFRSKADQSGDQGIERIAAVEQSMQDLTSAVREEISLLRKTLLAQSPLDQDDPSDD